MKTSSPNTDWGEIFRQRRNRIRAVAEDGVILWLGHSLQPRNYAANAYPFRQNSHFLYYSGISEPDLALLSFPDPDHDVLFADPAGIDDIVWTGPRPTPVDRAREAGIERIEPLTRLTDALAQARNQGARIHYLPPYQYSPAHTISQLLGVPMEEVGRNASARLMEQVALQRSVKNDLEVAEIEEALSITDRMHRECMAAVRSGIKESELAGLIQGIALSSDRAQAYDPIVTIHGEVLHNHSYDNVLQEGQLVLNDSGAESPMFYASDITRTFPVSGRFTEMQAAVYRIVLDMQLGAIAMIRPSLPYRDIHLEACRIMAAGLRDLDLMRGKPDDAVAAGAHALFFPHGIGHMLGLDVHDMEDLGDIVGHGKNKPTGQFGMSALRLSRPLEPGFVLTVEPGIYFIPALIERWEAEGRCSEFLDYDTIHRYRGFGGIRIEDNLLVTSTGARVLGPGTPKTPEEVERACNRHRGNQ